MRSAINSNSDIHHQLLDRWSRISDHSDEFPKCPSPRRLSCRNYQVFGDREVVEEIHGLARFGSNRAPDGYKGDDAERDVHAMNFHTTFGGNESVYRVNERSLASSIWADEADQLTRLCYAEVRRH